MLRGILGVTGIAAAAMAMAVIPAHADSPDHEFTLTISQGEVVVPDRTVTLTCDPDGGTHPDAVAACDIVRQVGVGLPDMNLNPDVACTMQWDPITVSVDGHYHEALVQFTKTYGNACQLAAQTGAFYAF